MDYIFAVDSFQSFEYLELISWRSWKWILSLFDSSGVYVLLCVCNVYRVDVICNDGGVDEYA